ncbi:MAG: FkbM family methyltransferase [Pseudorhodoplanes sp.]
MNPGTDPAALSYAQRFEDQYLLACFADRPDGFYLDIGAGHPVFDNVSFAFYLRGWQGIAVEPNPALAALARAVRPRDEVVEALVADAPGEADFFLVEDFHGLSTMHAAHARQAEDQFQKPSRAMRRRVTTLRALCETIAAEIDFLKIDVEGAEAAVIAGGDWTRHRPKAIVVEALAPYSLTPAWDRYEPVLFAHGYRYGRFDSLNRYYVREDEPEILRRLQQAPDSFPERMQFRNRKPPLDDAGHPDAGLARIVAGAALTRLPLLPENILVSLLTAGLPDLDRTADANDLAQAAARLFGDRAGALPPELLAGEPSVRELYARIARTDAFRTGCGRISASYAW